MRGAVRSLKRSPTWAEIGKKVGVSAGTARRRLIGTGWGIREAGGRPMAAMLRPGEVAGLLGIHINTVRRWSDQGILKAYKLGSRSDRRYLKKDVDAVLARQRDRLPGKRSKR